MTEPADSAGRRERLSRVLADYIEAIHLGRPLDRAALITEHPDLADVLRAFFRVYDDQALRGADAEAVLNAFLAGGDEVTVVSGNPARTIPASPGVASLGSVRYFGDYELLEEVARGGMGVIYKARQVSLNRVVALKMILAGRLAGEEDVGRFLIEAEAAARLDHPGIVPMYEIGEHEGQHYFSMGFVDGHSLAERIADGPLPPRQAAQIIRKTAEAVAYAHSRGVIHRDLKPANVLLAVRGDVDSDRIDAVSSVPASDDELFYEPRVTDFGLAKQTAAADSSGKRDLTTTGQILGTPSYMPPEQAAGDLTRIGPTTDVYSLGAILYCLVTGHPPFQADNIMDTLLQVLDKEPVPPRQLNSKLPADLDTICLKCLEKDPRRRYGSARELAEELQRYLNGEPIQARPVGKVERAWRWCKRNPVVAGLCALVVLLLLGGTAVSTSLAVLAHRRAESARIAKERAELQRQRADRKALEALREKQRADEKAAEALAEKARAESQLDRSEWLLYAGQIAAAKREWETNNVEAAWRFLNACRQDFRGWEHRFLFTRFTKGQQTITGHQGAVTCVDGSRDGKWIVTGGADRTVRVWDAHSRTAMLTLTGHEGRVASVAFSRDGKQIVSGGEDKIIKVWDVGRGKETLSISGHKAHVTSVVFSPNGKRIASGSWDKTLKVWDANSGKEIFTLAGHSDHVSSLAFSPDGKRIVSGSWDKSLKMWDAGGGEESASLAGHGHTVTSVAFSPDGRRIASGSWDNTIKIWDTESGRELRTLNGHAAAVTSVVFSPDGKRIASGSSDKTLRVWDSDDGGALLVFRGHARYLAGVVFMSNGKQIATAGGDGALKLWDAGGGQGVLTREGGAGEVTGVAYSAGGGRFASLSGRTIIRTWNAPDGSLLRTIQAPRIHEVAAIAIRPDGKRIVSAGGDKTLKLWDAANGRELLTFHGHKGEVACVAFSPDGRRFVSGGGDNVVRMWQAETGQEILMFTGHTGPIRSVAYAPGGKWIASGSEDGTVRIWDTENGQEVRVMNGRDGAVLHVAYSADGKRIVSAGADGALRMWDCQSGQKILTFTGHSGPVLAVAFSPDGGRIASGGADESLRIWSVHNGQELLSLKEHAGRVYAVAFNSDGGQIVSGSGDATIKFWRAGKN